MTASVVLAAVTAIIGLVFAVMLADQYRHRRRTFQLVWAIGMVFYAIAAGCEALAAASGWNDTLYRTYYLTGAVWSVGWLGLGTAFLLARTRFGYAFAATLFLAGLFTFLTDAKYHYPNSGSAPILYFIVAVVLAIAVVVSTLREDRRWPVYGAIAVIGATLLSLALMLTAHLAAPGYALDSATRQPVFDLLPGSLRLLTPYMNVTGAFSLLLGAVFSTYVFMPKRRVISYTLEAGQSAARFARNLVIAPVAIAVNLVASIPGAVAALFAGRLHSRVPSTILIAIGAFIPTVTDSASVFGNTSLRELGHLLAVVFIFAGFLVSIEVFADLRVPFTGVVLLHRRPETVGADARGGEAAGAH